MWASLTSSLTAARSPLAPRRHRGKAATEAQRAQRKVVWGSHNVTEDRERTFLGDPKKTSVFSVPLWLTSLCALRGRGASGYIVPAVPGMATGGTGIGPNSSVC